MRGQQAHLTSDGLDQVSEYRVELYICRLPEGLRVPLLVQIADVNNETTEEEEIDMEVQGLKSGRAGGGDVGHARGGYEGVAKGG